MRPAVKDLVKEPRTVNSRLHLDNIFILDRGVFLPPGGFVITGKPHRSGTLGRSRVILKSAEVRMPTVHTHPHPLTLNLAIAMVKKCDQTHMKVAISTFTTTMVDVD